MWILMSGHFCSRELLNLFDSSILEIQEDNFVRMIIGLMTNSNFHSIELNSFLLGDRVCDNTGLSKVSEHSLDKN